MWAGTQQIPGIRAAGPFLRPAVLSLGKKRAPVNRFVPPDLSAAYRRRLRAGVAAEAVLHLCSVQPAAEVQHMAVPPA
ncbi:hypothetical protein D3C75_895700 [compost metagenome]